MPPGKKSQQENTNVILCFFFDRMDIRSTSAELELGFVRRLTVCLKTARKKRLFIAAE